MSTCDESEYNKKLYGWLGVFHRQLQRSHYQIRYGHPVQLMVLTLVALLISKLIPHICFSFDDSETNSSIGQGSQVSWSAQYGEDYI